MQAGKKISEMPPKAEAVLQDMRTNLNTPFVIEFDPNKGELYLVLKTIIRKKDFTPKIFGIMIMNEKPS